MNKPRQSGVTLIELLVVLAIIGILVALLIPAVQRARESARATQCRSHLRQLGIALHHYHDAHGLFPPGCVGQNSDPVNIQGWGWGTFLLPFLEEQSLYDLLDPDHHSLPAVLASADRQPYLRVPLPIFRCASDVGDELQSENRTLSGFVLGTSPLAASSPQLTPTTPFGGRPLLACILAPPGSPIVLPYTPPSAPTSPSVSSFGVRAATSNYVASFGDLWRSDAAAWTANDYAGNGAFGSNVSLRMRDVTDGTSRTFALGERSWQSYASIWAGTDGWNRCEREGIAMVLATAFFALNSSPEPYYLSCDPKGAAGFGSMHSGGSHFLMLDGSVRFVADDIQFANDSDPRRLGVFQRLARRNDARPADEN